MSSLQHATESTPSCDWRKAQEEFLLHMEATRAKNTHIFYGTQLRSLQSWAESEGITFAEFRKRHLDRFLVFRTNEGCRPTTPSPQCPPAPSPFFRWCSRNDLLERDPLADYRVRNAPMPARPMPTDEDVRALLQALEEFWDIRKNSGAKCMGANQALLSPRPQHGNLPGTAGYCLPDRRNACFESGRLQAR